MTNDDIKRAAYKYAGDVNRNRKYGIEPYSVVDFMEDAEWRVNGVWHDAKEEPKYDKYFLYENVVHAYHVDGIYPSEDEPFVWDDYVKDWGLIRWAYIKDLIPDKEE